MALSFLMSPARCFAGFFSSTGLQPCSPCPLGSYQPSIQETFCFSCTAGTTTASTGAISSTNCSGFEFVCKSVSDFSAPCGVGSYSATGLEPCLPCSFGTYQNETQTTSCRSCPSGTNTSSTGRTLVGDCLGSTSNASLMHRPMPVRVLLIHRLHTMHSVCYWELSKLASTDFLCQLLLWHNNLLNWI
jgi:hypothetical protein